MACTTATPSGWRACCANTLSSENSPGTDRVLSIELVGPVTALAKLQCSIEPKHFTDLLTLIHVDGRWQVISKVFHYDVLAP